MLIAPKYIDADKKWGRDPGIKEMIDYFDLPSRRNQKERLSRKERNAIDQEIVKCSSDFRYAARNYFWIRPKDSSDRLYRLWASQEMIYEIMQDLKRAGRPQMLMILKARQLGVSTLVEALIAWRCMFNINVNALVVSHSEQQAVILFDIMVHIYNRLPWWLKPLKDRFEYKEGLRFANPDEKTKYINPGLNSSVVVQHATQKTGIGEGFRLNVSHLSEHAAWDPRKARDTIEGDMAHALVQSPETIAVVEGTGRGAGNYAHLAWLKNVELGENAKWLPVFLPSFMEPTRVLPPEGGWIPEEEEMSIRARVEAEWCQCDSCLRWARSMRKHKSLIGAECPCGAGRLRPYVLSDEQLFFMWREKINAKKDPESLRTLRQELAMTPEEAFQASGISVFPDDTRQIVSGTIRPPKYSGYLDNRGNFHAIENHATKRCYTPDCDKLHEFDDHSLQVWAMPQPGYEYSIGVDVAEGLGDDHDYSVAFVNRIGRGAAPDMQVALLRSNVIDAYSMASLVNFLGRWYNDALVAVEYNNYQTCGDNLRIKYQYPNLFRDRNMAAEYSSPNKWHWNTNVKSKPKLWQTAIRWIRAKTWVVQSEIFSTEMSSFQREEESHSVGAPKTFHDDVVMAGMIALYVAHQMDWTDSQDCIPNVVHAHGETFTTAAYTLTCLRCRNKWGVEDVGPYTFLMCPTCGNRANIGIQSNHVNRKKTVEFNWEELDHRGGVVDPFSSVYD